MGSIMDAIYLLLVFALFALAFGFIRLCERVRGQP
jgi:hypothetical protein